ncbi:MAG: hypothetical protein GWP61_03085 [Chloroflexi bacterium]|nr:hypothetical protein [Chloroflexota bacterium]
MAHRLLIVLFMIISLHGRHQARARPFGRGVKLGVLESGFVEHDTV